METDEEAKCRFCKKIIEKCICADDEYEDRRIQQIELPDHDDDYQDDFEQDGYLII